MLRWVGFKSSRKKSKKKIYKLHQTCRWKKKWKKPWGKSTSKYKKMKLIKIRGPKNPVSVPWLMNFSTKNEWNQISFMMLFICLINLSHFYFRIYILSLELSYFFTDLYLRLEVFFLLFQICFKCLLGLKHKFFCLLSYFF